MKLFKNKKGITLVELLAVLVILGIIAAIAVPTVNTLITNTRARADVESANSYVQAARLFALENLGENNTVVVTNGALEDYVSNNVEFTSTVFFTVVDGSISTITSTGLNTNTETANGTPIQRGTGPNDNTFERRPE